MGRYLIKASYTAAGARGLLDAGGKSRVDAVSKTAESAGGKMESFDFAFGSTDAFVICSLPDNAAAAKVALTVGAAGAAACETVVLIDPAELPAGSGSDVAYTPPGG
jgi:uncharacterized protein with GYD domain